MLRECIKAREAFKISTVLWLNVYLLLFNYEAASIPIGVYAVVKDSLLLPSLERRSNKDALSTWIVSPGVGSFPSSSPAPPTRAVTPFPKALTKPPPSDRGKHSQKSWNNSHVIFLGNCRELPRLSASDSWINCCRLSHSIALAFNLRR